MEIKLFEIEENKEIELRSEEYQEVLGSVPCWIMRRGIVLIALIVIVILVGSSVFKYPDIITSNMTLTATTPAVSLVAKTSGKLLELYVSDKEKIKSGDYLAVIENPAKKEDILYLKQYVNKLSINVDTLITLPSKRLNVGNIQALYSSFYIVLSDYVEFKQLQYYTKKIDFMQERIKQYEAYYIDLKKQKQLVEEQLLLNKRKFERDSIINKRGGVSDEVLESTKNQYIQGSLSLANTHSTIQNTEMQMTQMEENLLDTQYQYQDKKNTFETQLKTYIAQIQTEIQSWEQTYTFISPIDGQITFTTYWAENQNIVAGENVFNIIPYESGTLIGKATIPMNRSGKVKVGQNVNVRFLNFADNEFGVVKGIVNAISIIPSNTEVEKNNYIIEIGLPDGLKTTYNKELPYLPEMQAQADIITEDLSVLERFFMPLRKIWTEGVQ